MNVSAPVKKLPYKNHITFPPPKLTHMMVRHTTTMVGDRTDTELAVGLESIPLLIDGVGTLVKFNLSYVNVCHTERPILIKANGLANGHKSLPILILVALVQLQRLLPALHLVLTIFGFEAHVEIVVLLLPLIALTEIKFYVEGSKDDIVGIQLILLLIVFVSAVAIQFKFGIDSLVGVGPLAVVDSTPRLGTLDVDVLHLGLGHEGAVRVGRIDWETGQLRPRRTGTSVQLTVQAHEILGIGLVATIILDVSIGGNGRAVGWSQPGDVAIKLVIRQNQLRIRHVTTDGTTDGGVVRYKGRPNDLEERRFAVDGPAHPLGGILHEHGILHVGVAPWSDKESTAAKPIILVATRTNDYECISMVRMLGLTQ